MKKLRKIIVLMLIAVFVSLGLTGCSNESKHSSEEHPTKESATEEHPTKESATEEHPTKESATEEHPTKESATEEHPTTEHPE